MADGPNLFDMTESAINALKKPEIVKRIIELKDKVVVGEEIKSLCTHIKELTDTVNQLLSKNERLSSDLAIQKTVCGNLEKKVKSLEIQISKDEQYNCRNCVEFSGIPDTINDDNLEDTIIEACKDINIDVSETDIEACHTLPVRRNATNASKRVIVKFVNRKDAESIMSKKFTLSSTDFSRLNINNKVYVNPSLCPYYRYLWGRCKDLQRRKMMHHVFCLGSVVAIKLTDQSLPLKIYHDSDIPYSQSDSIAE